MSIHKATIDHVPSAPSFKSIGLLPTPNISAPGTPSLAEATITLDLDSPSAKLALRILEIIQQYGQNSNSSEIPWAGKAKFLPFVEKYVKNNEPVRMVLPAFPFKSPNRVDKVLGSLPDLGEELALMHLNGLCESIREVYEHGATVAITSDGLVYNDLMGVEDSVVWEYSAAVRDIIKAKNLTHLTTLRVVDILGTHEDTNADLTREEYLAHAGCYRRELMAKFGPVDFNSRDAVKSDKDICMTYKGYIKFLTKDLANSRLAKLMVDEKSPNKRFKRAIEELALKMIFRGKAFAAAISSKCANHVRLSIHPSIGETKLTIPLIPPPDGGQIMTPWHSSIAVGLDGSFRTVHADEVRDTHELMYRDRRPYYYREKSRLYDFGTTNVKFEYLYPCGLIIHGIPDASGAKPSFRDVDAKKIRRLAEMQALVVLRGFAETTNRELFISRAHELGEVQPWTFGILQEVKDSGRKDKLGNNVTSSEALAMHYDGVFKFVTQKDGNGNDMLDADGKEIKVQKPPKFQYFTCIATAPKGTGHTLFASSRLFFKHLPPPYTLARLEAVRWRMVTDGFWDSNLSNLPLVVRHPVHGTPCVRWHEPWPASNTKFSACAITIENDSQKISDVVNALLYDRRVTLRFEWEQGDILVSDNTAMLHTRTAYAGDSCKREMWRIHFD
ncbi:Clavaminate synthase-like protein [Lophium mytilinum]|uniref:Clavaminate synthase-like protein n=1 Tax=Lophium mytilinum TaxID=390894 RepID=A0A6A6Q9M5_9PEZI|nr:Clavaminate synthase-like protein [Lophium mytilinum]